jgi:hypothetical protein
MKDSGLLTPDEHKAIDQAAKLNTLIQKIIGNGLNSKSDKQEVELCIHLIQNMIMSQASARAYPKMYRLLGKSITKPEDKK